ncbi:MAG TPA: SH3 domain-containing protein [Elusimicrobiales bacterium]|nr:SH3 domain-containing protein [Elusimicrobiales bacterium]
MRIPTMLLAIMTVLAAPGAAEFYSVTSKMANVRSGPGGANESLWQVLRYAPFEVLGRSGAWTHVRDYEGDEGWVHGSILSKVRAVAVKTEKANLRETPGGEISWVLDRGYPMKLLKTEGNWVQVTDGEATGWLHRSVVWGLEEDEDG